jgi:hypothetical protein
MTTSSGSSNSQDFSQGDSNVFGLATVIIGPLAAVTLTECIFRFVHRTALVDTAIGPASLDYGPVPLIVLLLGYVSYFAFSRRQVAFTLALFVGVTISIFSIQNYRGSHWWPGFLEYEYGSKLLTYAPIAAAIVAGYILSKLDSRARIADRLKSALIFMIGLALAWSWIDSYIDIGMYTQVPFYRQYSLSLTAIVGMLFAFWGRFER